MGEVEQTLVSTIDIDMGGVEGSGVESLGGAVGKTTAVNTECTFLLSIIVTSGVSLWFSAQLTDCCSLCSYCCIPGIEHMYDMYSTKQEC